MKKWCAVNYKGIFLSAAVACAAVIAGYYLPIIGASVFGIVFGILIGNFARVPASCSKGLDYASKKILKIAIVLIGAGLSFHQVLATGADTFFLMLFTISAAFITAFAAGKIMGVSSSLKSLIGVGTAVCGGSAIAAIAPIIDAEDKDISYSISTIFLFNIAAVFIFPPLGHLFGFTDNGFGLWAGTAVNDTSSVVAAGYTFSAAAGDYATIVKLTRT
ncbi:MAG: YeiH family protein, partial [Spirochaetota bacterium]